MIKLAPLSRSASKDVPLVSGEFHMTWRDFNQIAALIHSDSGIFLQEAKASLVYGRLAKRLRELSLRSFSEYVDLVSSADGCQERVRMTSALTTNVTNFFREGHHFQHLKNVVLPTLIKAAKRGERVRLWSAACSSGQEAYSIALTLLSVFPDAGEYDVRILATDIDAMIIAEARRGVYRESAMSNVSADNKNRYFQRHKDAGENVWRVSDDVRSLVTFKEMNLVAHWPMKGPFQVIFCRNVVIYFDQPTQHELWSKFASKVTPEGWLYIGHSERVSGDAEAVFECADVSTYRVKSKRAV